MNLFLHALIETNNDCVHRHHHRIVCEVPKSTRFLPLNLFILFAVVIVFYYFIIIHHQDVCPQTYMFKCDVGFVCLNKFGKKVQTTTQQTARTAKQTTKQTFEHKEKNSFLIQSMRDLLHFDNETSISWDGFLVSNTFRLCVCVYVCVLKTQKCTQKFCEQILRRYRRDSFFFYIFFPLFPLF